MFVDGGGHRDGTALFINPLQPGGNPPSDVRSGPACLSNSVCSWPSSLIAPHAQLPPALAGPARLSIRQLHAGLTLIAGLDRDLIEISNRAVDRRLKSGAHAPVHFSPRAPGRLPLSRGILCSRDARGVRHRCRTNEGSGFSRSFSCLDAFILWQPNVAVVPSSQPGLQHVTACKPRVLRLAR